jgi:voltage-gated potassium channel
VLGILVGSTVGFVLLEDYSWVNAFYMSIITVSTVGFGEIQPLSETGRLFTSAVIILSFGVFAYAISTITQFVLDGELRNYLKYYKVNKRLEKIRDHVIVCGYGRNGSQAVEELLGLGKKVVIIDQDEMLLDRTPHHPNLAWVQGNAIQDETLIQAHIGRAYALITTMPKDADNLFVVLTARELNPRLIIISRASEDHSYSKLKRAGATNVIMPDKVGGMRMAKLVAQPDIVEFIENILLHEQDEVNLEEISCEDLPHCNIHRSIRDFNVRDLSGANIIGLKTPEGSYIYNPSPDFKLSTEDKLFALGTPRQIASLRLLLAAETTTTTTTTTKPIPHNRFTPQNPTDPLL